MRKKRIRSLDQEEFRGAIQALMTTLHELGFCLRGLNWAVSESADGEEEIVLRVRMRPEAPLSGSLQHFLDDRVTPYTAPKPQPEPLFVRPADAARMLSVSKATIQKMLTSGELPSAKPGRFRLIAVAEIHAWLEAHARR